MKFAIQKQRKRGIPDWKVGMVEFFRRLRDRMIFLGFMKDVLIGLSRSTHPLAVAMLGSDPSAVVRTDVWSRAAVRTSRI